MFEVATQTNKQTKITPKNSHGMCTTMFVEQWQIVVFFCRSISSIAYVQCFPRQEFNLKRTEAVPPNTIGDRWREQTTTTTNGMLLGNHNQTHIRAQECCLI